MRMMSDARFMRLALRLARRGCGTTSPNPMVGAVLVKGGKIIGRGWHRRAGEAHAEIEALRDAQRRGHPLRDATLYVTLEPCCTHGRTPPCTDAIIAAGIKRVVAGTTDPNPRHSGRAFKILRRAGIEVVWWGERPREPNFASKRRGSSVASPHQKLAEECANRRGHPISSSATPRSSAATTSTRNCLATTVPISWKRFTRASRNGWRPGCERWRLARLRFRVHALFAPQRAAKRNRLVEHRGFDGGRDADTNTRSDRDGRLISIFICRLEFRRGDFSWTRASARAAAASAARGAGDREWRRQRHRTARLRPDHDWRDHPGKDRQRSHRGQHKTDGRHTAALRDSGIEQKDIQTSHFSVQPVYAPAQPNTEPRLSGFSVSNQLSVTIHQIAAVGPILDRLIAAGANDLGGVEFLHSDLSKALDRAREAAVADARRKAELYARAQVGAWTRCMDHRRSRLRSARWNENVASRGRDCGAGADRQR